MKFRRTLFWDTDPKKIDVKKNAQYIIERIADFGNDKEARWALEFYNKALLKKVVAKSRSLRPDTRKLWTMLIQK
ncbi:MAG: hypothetical protein AAB467_02555 [Patescibacteria group bacterium]